MVNTQKVNILNMMVVTTAIRHTNKGREKLSRSYLDLLHCYYLLTLEQPRPLYYVPKRFGHVLYIADYKTLKARTEKLIQLGYLERMETGKPRPQYVYQITISGINRLHELQEAAQYLIKLAKKRMKK